MAPESNADEARTRSDEAVQRIREESRRRVEQRGRVRAFSSWCALATLAGGISLTALDAHQRAVETRDRTRAEEACALLAQRQIEIQAAMQGVTTLYGVDTVRAHAAEELATARRIARESGCLTAIEPPAPDLSPWRSRWEPAEPIHVPHQQ